MECREFFYHIDTENTKEQVWKNGILEIQLPTGIWRLPTSFSCLTPPLLLPANCPLPTGDFCLTPHYSCLTPSSCQLAPSSSPLTTHASRLLPAYCQLATARCPLPTANWLLLLTPHASRLTPSSSSRLNTN